MRAMELSVVATWVAVAIIHVGLVWVARSTSRMPDLTPPRRRFWRAVAAAGVIYLLGDVAQLVFAAEDPLAGAAATGGKLQMTALSAGSALMMFTLLTVPVGVDSRRERVRFWMDVATVMVAAVVVGWHLVAPDLPGALVKVVAGPVVLLLCVFVVAKLVMSGTAPFTRACGLIGAGAAVIKSGADWLVRDGVTEDRLYLYLACTVVSHALLVVALRVNQVQLTRDAGRRRERPEKPYSLLPYAAIAVTYLLLTIAVAQDATRTVPIALAGAALSTLLVVLRQFIAFRENEQLLAQRDALAARLRHQAFHDGLTGLPNRALYAERLEAAVAGGAPVVAMLVDLDDFKEVNDRWGHAAGDALLRRVADRLTGCVRDGDTVARLGGDEFAVLLIAAHDDDPAEIAARMVAAVEAPITLDGFGQARVGVSIGVAVSGARTRDGDSLLREADHAMYAVKRDGKGSYALA
jgi:diguanylate cyclase (GGDEF)-like protein